MYVQKRILMGSLVALTVAATGAIAYLATHNAAAAPVPADKAERDLERTVSEWREQERRHAEEMVKVRLALTECEENLATKEDELRSTKSELTLVRQRIKRTLEVLNQAQVPKKLLEEEKELSATERKCRADVLQARQQLLAADERTLQLGREQALTRDRIRARLEAAEAKLRSEQGIPQGNTSNELKQRLEDVEQILQRIRRDFAAFQKQSERRSP
jgi:hypothetical protein